MYFYIFFVVYLANNFSNGLIFKTNPLDKNKELFKSALPGLKNYFNSNIIDKNGMKLEELAEILMGFNFIQKIPHEIVKESFVEIVGDKDGLMNFDQFKMLATILIRRYEKCIEHQFNAFSNKTDKMTLEKLVKALEIFNIVYTEKSLIILMNHFEGRGAQFISMKAFRNIFGYLFYKKIDATKDGNLDDISILH
ncbi:uncharacterized protein LOC126901304 [Daktulosphaira vitifoliae]|uniref:uncharacterized protein LOC126901304 n=1 Tax=Daktulosphaira vitifoliae TaxID=58002 RepID=UPI0021AA917A|nr:uncharacterized protein LOC126901304 [Daktulosphaira vitifoliae]